MLSGHAHILRIEQHLKDWNGDREALARAVNEYLAAVAQCASWPPDVLAWCRRLNCGIAAASLGSVTGNADAVERLVRELLDFVHIAAAERRKVG